MTQKIETKNAKKLQYQSPLGAWETVFLVAEIYENTGNINLQGFSDAKGFLSPLTTITVDHESLPPYCGYIRSQEENKGILEFIKSNGLGYVLSQGTTENSDILVQFCEEALFTVGCERLEAYHKGIEARYCGKVDFLGCDGLPIETIYYQNRNELQQEQSDSCYCGRPITVKVYHSKTKDIHTRINQAIYKHKSDEPTGQSKKIQQGLTQDREKMHDRESL